MLEVGLLLLSDGDSSLLEDSPIRYFGFTSRFFGLLRFPKSGGDLSKAEVHLVRSAVP
jgi:hypothetical protein